MLACLRGHQSVAMILLEKGDNIQLHNKVSLYITKYIILCKKINLYGVLLKRKHSINDE